MTAFKYCLLDEQGHETGFFNSRGEVASTDSGGRFTNGFLPRSVGIGGHPSFLINTVDVDVRYSPGTAPIMLFTRFQLLPRFSNDGENTRVIAEQAFARIIPFASQEFQVCLTSGNLLQSLFLVFLYQSFSALALSG